MPYVDYALAGAISAPQGEQIKIETARILSQYVGKSEQWLYIRINPNQSLFFRGEQVPVGAIAEVKLVGGGVSTTKAGDYHRPWPTFTERVIDSSRKNICHFYGSKG